MAEITAIANDDIGSQAQTYAASTQDRVADAPVDAKGQPRVLSDTASTTMANAITYGLPVLGAGFIDTVGTSLHILGDDAVSNALKTVSPDGIGDYYARNKTAIRAGADITGMLIPGYLGMQALKGARVLREAGNLGTILKNSTALDWLLGSSTTMATREAAIKAAALKGLPEQGLYAGRTFATPEIKAAKTSYYASRVLEGVRQSAAMEVGYRVLFNNSEIFYPADYTAMDQVKWGIAGAAVGGGIELALGRLAVRKLVQGVARDGDPLVQYGSDIAETVFRPNDRGVGVTRYAVVQGQLKDIIQNSGSPLQASNLSQDVTVTNNAIITQIQAMGKDTHAFLNSTALELGEKKGAPGQVNLVLDALQHNPTTLLYSTKLAQVPEDITTFYTGIEKNIAAAEDNFVIAKERYNKVQTPKLLSDLQETQAKFSALQAAADESHFVIESTGELSPLRTRAESWSDTHSWAEIKRTTFADTVPAAGGGGATVSNVTRSKVQVGDQISINDDFTTNIPQKPSSKQWSQIYAAASKMIAEWKPVKGQILQVTEKSSAFQVEGMLNLIAAKPEAAAVVQFAGKFAGDEKKAAFWLLNEKYKKFNALMDETERQPRTALAQSVMNKGKLDPAQVLQQLNLPMNNGITLNPLVETFGQARLQGAKTFDEIFNDGPKLLTIKDDPLDLFQASMRETAGVTDPSVTFDISGRMMQQKDIRPVLVASKGVPTLAWSDQVVHNAVMVRRDLALKRLAEIDPGAAPLVSKVVNDLAGQAAISAAKDVMALHDGVLSGKGIVVAQDRINEQSPTLKALMLLAQKSDKIIQQHVAERVDGTLTPVAAKLLSGKNNVDLIDFNRIEHSYRHGWEVSGLEQAPNGKFALKLTPADKSAQNQRLMERHFPDLGPEDFPEYMPDMSTTALQQGMRPLYASADAAAAAKAVSDLSIQSGVENNALRVSLGTHPIKLRDFHLPSPDLGKRDTWFVRNPAGNVVATYGDGTASSNKSRALAAAATLDNLNGGTHVAIPVDDVRREHSVFDDKFLDLIDYSGSGQIAKTGAGISGAAAKTTIDTTSNTLEAMITSLNDQYLSVGIRARAAIFEPQINYAVQAGQLAKQTAGDDNIFNRYIATMFSRSPVSGTGVVGKVYGALGTALDDGLSVANAFYSEAIASTEAGQKGARSLRQIVKRQTSDTEFRQYQDAAKGYTPFETTLDWLASTHPEIPTWSARSLLGKASLVSSTMSLRFLDVGMAWLNMLGTATVMPAVMRSMRALPGETREALEHRTAAWSSKATDAELRTFSATKAAMTTFHSWFKGDAVEPMARAAAQGYFVPEYAAMARLFTDPKHGGKSGFAKVVDGASYLADHSEAWSRQIAWYTGYKIAKDLHKFDDERNAFLYANNFVNETIGNYNPRNKPGMFQGTVGLPLGAFQTYMFNHYRRMFGYLERGDWSSIAAGYAAQATAFGAGSVPGWSAYNTFLFSNYDGSDNLATRLDRKLPAGVSELITHGSISSIPTIFGQGGIAFYARGSVDWTQPPPTIDDITRAPPIQFLAGVAKGMKATIENVFSAGGFSIPQQEQILANMSTNRAAKSVMEFAAGAKTDQRSEVIDYATRDAIHIAAALLGATTSNTRRMQDAYSAQQAVQLHQEDLRAQLTDKTRTLLRNGDITVDALQDMVQQYVRSGGNADYFGSWLRSTMETATTPKAISKLKSLATGERWLEFMNMLSALQQNAPAEASPTKGAAPQPIQ